ncbi:hypothetical protein D1AOALGA4SA_10345 [Olavius algarvensis Delta 1 endosymbiont]|nr:hypothetical protein D1AOALGA4SA_10345 [Olavius algarvensis Delta 1 endosymbiont]
MNCNFKQARPLTKNTACLIENRNCAKPAFRKVTLLVSYSSSMPLDRFRFRERVRVRRRARFKRTCWD